MNFRTADDDINCAVIRNIIACCRRNYIKQKNYLCYKSPRKKSCLDWSINVPMFIYFLSLVGTNIVTTDKKWAFSAVEAFYRCIKNEI